MKDICPNCEKITELELVVAKEGIGVRGEPIEVNVEFFRCLDCGTEFEDPRSSVRPLEEAFERYRKNHGMIQPEEMKSFRKRLGLSQNEMGKLLGWGSTTLSRYENGALQDIAHDKSFRLAMEPRNLLMLIKETPGLLPKEKMDLLISELKTEVEISESLERIFEERYGNYEPTIMSGYKRIDLEKLFNAITFFCSKGTFKTTLNKLLFYIDFKHFRVNSVSITGATYAHIPFGPALDRHSFIFAIATENKLLRLEEMIFSEDVVGEKFTSLKPTDLSVFSESEVETLVEVKKYFRGFSAQGIHDFSSKEKGYKETVDGELISYEYAADLQI